MERNLPLVSVVVPCRNEEKFIGQCLESIIRQDYPKEKLEVLVVDGMSNDKTRGVVARYVGEHPFIKLLDNFEIFTPFALNIGIKKSQGEIIIRMDAHAKYSQDYIVECVKNLQKYNADNVGGSLVVVASKNGSLFSRAIAWALSSVFCAGNAHYKTIHSGSPRFVDTVLGGCYKRELFDRMGLFNEKLPRCQDIDFNMRLTSIGGKILLVPNIFVYYYPRASLKNYFFRDLTSGEWIIYSSKFMRRPLKLRHYLPAICFFGAIGLLVAGFWKLVFWLVLAGLAAVYVFLSLFFSVRIAAKERNWRFVFLMPLAFASRHLAYGLGSVLGLAKLILNKKNEKC
jgi:glycosyltransferase involved in cell wall biosynthesis